MKTRLLRHQSAKSFLQTSRWLVYATATTAITSGRQSLRSSLTFTIQAVWTLPFQCQVERVKPHIRSNWIKPAISLCSLTIVNSRTIMASLFF